MSILIMLIIGGLVGWLAARLMGRDEGVVASVLIGIVGSFIGSFVSKFVVGSDQSFLAFSAVGVFWSLLGAVILVAIMNYFSARKRGHRGV